MSLQNRLQQLISAEIMPMQPKSTVFRVIALPVKTAFSGEGRADITTIAASGVLSTRIAGSPLKDERRRNQ